jgi:hypothetical protein
VALSVKRKTFNRAVETVLLLGDRVRRAARLDLGLMTSP